LRKEVKPNEYRGGNGHGRRTSMKIKEGDIFKNSLDGVDFAVKKIVNDMAVLESQDKRRQILTEVNTLKLGSFYLKKERKDL
jgi:hypothetical protein